MQGVKVAQIPDIEVDPDSLDIIEGALKNARHEMDAVLFRTAMSPVIREQHLSPGAVQVVPHQLGELAQEHDRLVIRGNDVGEHRHRRHEVRLYHYAAVALRHRIDGP